MAVVEIFTCPILRLYAMAHELLATDILQSFVQEIYPVLEGSKVGSLSAHGERNP
jgi:hypothetical protein